MALFKRSRRIAAIPAVTDKNVASVVDALKSVLEEWDGAVGAADTTAVLAGDLQNAELGRVLRGKLVKSYSYPELEGLF